MTIENPTVQACLVRLEAEGFPEAMPPFMPGPCREVLSDPEAVRALVAEVASRDDSGGEEVPPEPVLLGWLLDEARQNAENGKAAGQLILGATAEALEGLAGRATHAGVRALARAYTQAELEPPEALVRLRESLRAAEGAGAQDPVEALEGLRGVLREGSEDPHGLYMSLSEVLAAERAEARRAAVYGLSAMDEEPAGDLALYWLLDRDGDLRLAAAQGLLDRARGGSLDGRTAARLPLLRSWLPADEVRGLLDQVVREARRTGLGGQLFPVAGATGEGVALLPDGVGALYLMLPVTSPEGTPAVAMVLTKAGYGLKDAHLMPDVTLGDLQAHLAEMPGGPQDAIPLGAETFRELTAIALGEGLEAGLLPPPGLLDVVAAMGLADLYPEPVSLQDWVERVDPTGAIAGLTPQKRGRLINRSGEWPQWHPMLTTWFEDTPGLRELLSANLTPRTESRRLWQYLETRRTFWAEQCLKAARLLRDTATPDHWRSFAATGAALLEGRELKRIPIMEAILANTREALGSGVPEAGFGDLPMEVVIGGYGGDELAQADPSGPGWPEETMAWVEGFLMAVVTAPRAANIRKWMGEMLAALPEPEDEAEGEATLDELLGRYEDLRALCGPDSVEGPALPADEELLGHWAAGFHRAVTSGKAGWSGRKPGREDRLMLDIIAELARGESSRTNVAGVVRQWLAARLG